MKTTTSEIGIFKLLLLTIFILLIIFISIVIRNGFVVPQKYRPPDLTGCTRLEIHYFPSARSEFGLVSSLPGILNNEEIEFIDSFRVGEVKDIIGIKKFINQVSKSVHIYEHNEYPANVQRKIMCYSNNEFLTSITLISSIHMVTEDNKYFGASDYWMGFSDYIPELKPFQTRLRCAANQRQLFWRGIESKGNYPLYDSWCDGLVEAFPPVWTPNGTIELNFTCPGARKGKCHYAMNPNCNSESPDDMVLLFETKDGWNQHGGPELFTFDNHDPKGGCVLLNDGTVKFIRTMEELNSLRWK